MRKKDLTKTREFKCIKKPPLKRRRIGLFFTGFILSLVISVGAVGLMVVDYRGRKIATGNAGSVFALSSNEQSHRVTVFGYDFYVQKSALEEVGLFFSRTGEYLDKSIPLYVKISVNQKLAIPKLIVSTLV